MSEWASRTVGREGRYRVAVVVSPKAEVFATVELGDGFLSHRRKRYPVNLDGPVWWKPVTWFRPSLRKAVDRATEHARWLARKEEMEAMDRARALRAADGFAEQAKALSDIEAELA